MTSADFDCFLFFKIIFLKNDILRFSYFLKKFSKSKIEIIVLVFSFKHSYTALKLPTRTAGIQLIDARCQSFRHTSFEKKNLNSFIVFYCLKYM